MRSPARFRPAAVLLLLLIVLLVGQAILDDVAPGVAEQGWPIAAARILAALAGGALLTQLLVVLVRQRRGAPPVSVVPGGLDHLSGSARRQRVRPAELPPPPGLLQGRDDELDEMWRYLQGAVPTAGPRGKDDPRVIVVHGEPGVGKTALALTMAHLVADDYPDGQLLLRFDSFGDQLIDEPLAVLVNALKGPRQDLPKPDELPRWYHEYTQQRRVLVILDNIGDLAQIGRLLPAGRRCLAIITSRTRLTDLGPALTLPLKPLRINDAGALLGQLVGVRRLAAEPAYAEHIVAATAGYPVAVHMAAAVLAERRNWTLEGAVRRMSEVELDRRGGDPPFAGILDLAFAPLTEEEYQALILLGLVNARRVEPWMLAALFNGAFPDRTLDQDIAGRLLDRLARARFTERRVDDNSGLLTYRVPVYVHSYALTRLDSYLTSERRARATDAMEEEERRRSDESAEEFLRKSVYPDLDEGELDEAMEKARESLARCQAQISSASTPSARVRAIAGEGLTLVALGEVYAELGWINEALACAAEAVERERLSPHTLPRARRLSGSLYRRQHQLALAESDLAEALDAVGRIHDELEHIRVLRELIELQALRGDLAGADQRSTRSGELGAEEYVRRAEELCGAHGATGANHLPPVLLAYAKVLQARKRYEMAGEVLSRAERLTGEPGGRHQLSRPWIRLQLALVLLDDGRYDQSRELSFTALEGFTALWHRYGAAHARLALGRAHLAESRLATTPAARMECLDRAVPPLEECHATFGQCGDRWIEADAATALADAYRGAGRGQEAIRLLAAAEQAFAKLGDTARVERTGHLLWTVESTLPAEPSPEANLHAWLAAGRQALHRAGSGIVPNSRVPNARTRGLPGENGIITDPAQPV